jgi:hypothetical protein
LHKFEKKDNLNKAALSKFLKVTIIQFNNVALLVLLINFDFFDGPALGVIPLLNGSFTSFDERFYKTIGTTIQSTMVLSIISPQIAKLKPLFVEFL